MEEVAKKDGRAVVRLFEDYKGSLTASVIVAVMAAAADVALVIAGDDSVAEIAHCEETLASRGLDQWLGRPWADTVTAESRSKIADVLRDARANADGGWRQVNHPMDGNIDLPIRYIAVPFGSDGQVLALGRDMQRISDLQQELVQAQQAMEREYMRLRHAETKYRALFQAATEAILILDAQTYRIEDANPAAIKLLDATAGQLIGRYVRDWVVERDQDILSDLFSSVRRNGIAAVEAMHLVGLGDDGFAVSASLVRQGQAANLLVRVVPNAQAAQAVGDWQGPSVAEIINTMPEGFVVTDPDGRIKSANAGFLDIAQLPTEDAAIGQPIGRWVGRSEYEIKALIGNLRDHGVVRMCATSVRGELGSAEDVELSAVSVADGANPCLGFSVRSVESRQAKPGGAELPGPRSVEQLTSLVGRVSLKELVREATEVIERLSIEAALELTGDNRASAAEMLGLSRQSLYAKLHRYGLGDLSRDGEA